MKNIQIVSKFFYPLKGGIEHSMEETYSRLVEDGFTVTVHATRDNYGERNAFDKTGEFKGIKIKRYNKTWFGFWPKIDWEKADIVTLHNFNIFPHLLVMVYTLWRKINRNKNYMLIFHTHGGYTPRWSEFSILSGTVKKIYHKTLGKWLVNLTVDRVRAVSLWEAEVLKEQGIKCEIWHIPSGLEDVAFADDNSLVSQATKDEIKNLGRYIIQVGKVTPSKNHSTVIKALKHIPGDIKYVIVGKKCDEIYYKKLKELVFSLDLADRVIFTGYVDSEKKYYLVKNALAVVNLPILECYGAAVYETMANGAIVVVGEGTAPGILAEKNKSGITVDPENEVDTAKAVNKILNNINSAEFEIMRKNATIAMKAHSWEVVKEKFIELFSWQKSPVIFKPKLNKTKKTILRQAQDRLNKKLIVLNIVLFVLCGMLLVASVKGMEGSPQVNEFTRNEWRDGGPFELSPERGRWGLTYAFAELNSYKFPIDLGRSITPDLAVNSKKEFVSLFAPGMSVLAIPFYYLGKIFGHSQFGTFLMVSLFALLNAILIYAIARKLGLSYIASWLSVLTFLFATTAYPYAASLYQHHITTFLILLSLFLLKSEVKALHLFIVWFMIGLSITIDNPNFFLLFPVGVWALLETFGIATKNDEKRIIFNIDYKKIISIAGIIVPILLFGIYNNAANGSFTKLSGTLPSVKWITDKGEIINHYDEIQEEKKAVLFFKTRNMINGAYTLVLSPDRGFLLYSPIVIFGFWGLFYVYKRNDKIGNYILSIVGVNFILYSMWGDPYGGWAFGPRYLIPAFSLLALASGFWIDKYGKRSIWIFLWLIIFLYSCSLNSLGALTTSMNPPRTEVIKLTEATGKIEDFTYLRNYNWLQKEGSKSFVYRKSLSEKISPFTYWIIITSIICLMTLTFSLYQLKAKKND